jgi:tetratricopeptide (TPR) repeat protein
VRRFKLPSSVRELAWALAARLSSSTRTYLRLAAHVGTEIPRHLFDNPEAAGPESLAAITEAGSADLMTSDDRGIGVSFATPSIREAARMLPVERGDPRGNASAVVAAALVHTQLDDGPLHNDLLALHARIGGLQSAIITSSAASAAYHGACGNRTLATDAYQVALMALYKTAARDASRPKRIARILQLMASTTEWTALSDPLAAADFAIPLLKDLATSVAPDAHAKLLRERARLLIGLGRMSEAERELDEAIALRGAEEDPEAAAQTLSVRALLYEARKDTDTALVQTLEAVEIIEGHECRDRDLPWILWMTVGRYYSLVPDTAQARGALSRAFSEATRAKSVRGTAEITDLTARVWYDARDVGAAIACYDLAADHWLAWGDRQSSAQSLQASALILARELRVDEALTRARRALKLSAEAGWTAGVDGLQKMIAVLDARS